MKRCLKSSGGRGETEVRDQMMTEMLETLHNCQVRVVARSVLRVFCYFANQGTVWQPVIFTLAYLDFDGFVPSRLFSNFVSHVVQRKTLARVGRARSSTRPCVKRGCRGLLVGG